jgi:hypothetical protein
MTTEDETWSDHHPFLPSHLERTHPHTWTIWVLGFDSRRWLGIFLFFQTVSGAHPASYSWVPGAFSLGLKRQRREADHSPPSSAEVKKCVELYLHSPNTPSWRGAQLKEYHRDVTCSWSCHRKGRFQIFCWPNRHDCIYTPHPPTRTWI